MGIEKFLISYIFVSEVGLIPVQAGPIVVHPGLDSVLSRVSSTVRVRTGNMWLFYDIQYIPSSCD